MYRKACHLSGLGWGISNGWIHQEVVRISTKAKVDGIVKDVLLKTSSCECTVTTQITKQERSLRMRMKVLNCKMKGIIELKLGLGSWSLSKGFQHIWCYRTIRNCLAILESWGCVCNMPALDLYNDRYQFNNHNSCLYTSLFARGLVPTPISLIL